MLYLINPHLVCHRDDVHSSGIPYLPFGLAYVSTELEKEGIVHEVIDVFGAKPRHSFQRDAFLFFGLSIEEIISSVVQVPTGFVLYANAVFNAESLFVILRAFKETFPGVPCFVIENTNAVTGFSLEKCEVQLREAGMTHLVLGEAEASLPKILKDVSSLVKKFPAQRVENLETLGYPNWKKFPLENYWKLKVAHGPMENRYLALLTSRGCPYPCGFCSVPVMNNQTWRKRTALSVVDEIEHFYRSLGITEFHWEDVNPTIDEKRMQEISRLIIERNLKISWKLVSGTKMDNLSLETLELMIKSGMDYISFSPESGSPEVLKLIRKPFKHAHAVEQVKLLSKHKVHTQACFVIGFPGETDPDRLKTLYYSRTLVRAGLSEVAYFMIAPMPGTPIENKFQDMPSNPSELTFTPSWRADFKNLEKWRKRLYRNYFLCRILFQPRSFLRSCINALRGRYELKMEMFTRRLVWLSFARLRAVLSS